MPNPVRPLNIMDFTGGLNLRSGEFQLAENESPDMLNVEVDRVGGLSTRKGWDRWNTADVTADTWDPRSAFIHELAAGTDIMLIANGTKVHRSINGTFSELETAAATPLVVGADPHLADFAPWGDTAYIAAGRDAQSAKLIANGSYASLLTIAATATWNSDYLAPTTGTFPKADFVAAHAGRMWVASTNEDGVAYPHRVRWSHPNQAEDWKKADYVDILEGGGPITGIVPFEDHILVFKASSIWAIYGYDTESHQIVNVSRSLGALNRQVIARNENTVFFVSWPQGVHAINGGQLSEVSNPLRPAFTSNDWNQSATEKMWLGWLGQRLWFAVPYWEDGVATDARSNFVFDPSVGSWTMFRSASDEALGPYAQGGFGQGSYDLYGIHRGSPNVVRVDQTDVAKDNIEGTAVAFTSRYTTRWLHADWPDRKKRWKRPTFIAHEQDLDYTLKCSIYTDYGEKAPKRRFDVAVSNSGETVTYTNDDSVQYGDGSLYGAGAEGSTLRRGGSFGSAKAVQLQIDGEAGKPWGIDGIVAKYRMRRFT